ncbi:MAG: VaFE repeat-containing surface-anchored protein [Eggerthella lenta]
MFESLRRTAPRWRRTRTSPTGQTVRVAVEVGTQAADAADGDQVIEAGKAKVVDTVAYKGLVPGETYIAVARSWTRAPESRSSTRTATR